MKLADFLIIYIEKDDGWLTLFLLVLDYIESPTI